MLTTTDLSVDYAGVIALDAVDIEVRDGEAVGLIGSNGAGKTSLLKAISGLVPTRGVVVLDGEDVTGAPPHGIARRGVAHVPEGSRLFPHLTVEENLALGAYSRGAPSEDEFRQMYELFPRLRDRRKQPAGTLSGGERQMAAIARALMLRPRLLMLDEPSLGLAPVLVDAVYETIGRLTESGQTILLVEQNVAECLEVTARAYVLQTGRIVEQGPSGDLRRSDAVRRAFMGL